MAKSFEENLCEILVAKKALDLTEAVNLRQDFKNKSSYERFDDYLAGQEIVEKRILLACLSDLYQVPSFEIAGFVFDRDLVTLFPQDLLMRHVVLPIEIDGDALFVATSDPSNQAIIQNLSEYVAYEIQPFVAIRQEILDVIVEVFENSSFDEFDSNSFNDQNDLYEKDQFFNDVFEDEE